MARVFTTACTLLSCALYGVAPSTDHVVLALVIFGGALIASDLAWVFYNSLLPRLVDREHLGRVSGWAWSLGYFGGMLSLVLALVLFIREAAPFAVLDTGQSEPIRATAILAGLWVTMFALPLYLLTPDPAPRTEGMRAAVRAGMRELRETLRHARRYCSARGSSRRTASRPCSALPGSTPRARSGWNWARSSSSRSR